MATVHVTRSTQIENLNPLSGNEALTIETVQLLEQTISADAEEEVTASFEIHVLDVFSVLCAQESEVMLIETRFAVLQTVQGPPGTITHTGDLEQEIFPGDLIRLENTVIDDGVYLVVTVVEGGGTTTITLENGQALPAGGAGAVGTVARVASKMISGYSYQMDSSTAASGLIEIVGNITDKFSEGDFLNIQNTIGNDGYWQIRSVVWNAPNTEVVVNVAPGGAAGLPATEADVGGITKVSSTIPLKANIPFVWTDASGQQNPFITPQAPMGLGVDYNADRGAVVAFMVDNTLVSTPVSAAFRAVIGTRPDIF